MKITFVQAVPTGATPVRLISGSLNRFVERDGASSLEVGYGSKKPLSQRKMTILLRKIIVVSKQNKLKSISLDWKEIRSLADKSVQDKKLGEIAAVAFGMANFDFNIYKSEPKEGFDSVEDIAVLNAPKPVREGVARGEVIAIEVNSTRTLSNTPGGDMTPKVLAESAKTIAKGTKVQVKVIGRAELEKLGMGGVVGIAKGSIEEPQFIIAEYMGGAKSKKPVVLIGKGATFATGGLNLK